MHAAAWDEQLVDFVRLYVTPHALGPAGVPLLGDRRILDRVSCRTHVESLGPDVLIEGYVHGPR